MTGQTMGHDLGPRWVMTCRYQVALAPPAPLLAEAQSFIGADINPAMAGRGVPPGRHGHTPAVPSPIGMPEHRVNIYYLAIAEVFDHLDLAPTENRSNLLSWAGRWCAPRSTTSSRCHLSPPVRSWQPRALAPSA